MRLDQLDAQVIRISFRHKHSSEAEDITRAVYIIDENALTGIKGVAAIARRFKTNGPLRLGLLSNAGEITPRTQPGFYRGLGSASSLWRAAGSNSIPALE